MHAYYHIQHTNMHMHSTVYHVSTKCSNKNQLELSMTCPRFLSTAPCASPSAGLPRGPNFCRPRTCNLLHETCMMCTSHMQLIYQMFVPLAFTSACGCNNKNQENESEISKTKRKAKNRLQRIFTKPSVATSNLCIYPWNILKQDKFHGKREYHSNRNLTLQ